MDPRIKADLHLQQAITLRDVFGCNYPYAIGGLQEPKRLAELYELTSLPAVFFEQKNGGRFQFKEEKNSVTASCFVESGQLIAAHQDSVVMTSKSYTHPLQGWHSNLSGRRSGIKNHGVAPHFDHLHSPKTIVSLVANSTSTFIVPHAHMLAVLSESPFAYILDQPLQGGEIVATADTHWSQIMGRILSWPNPSIDQKKREQMKFVSQALWSQTVQYIPNTVFRMSGLTLHIQPPNLPEDRVCLISNTCYNIA